MNLTQNDVAIVFTSFVGLRKSILFSVSFLSLNTISKIAYLWYILHYLAVYSNEGFLSSMKGQFHFLSGKIELQNPEL